MLASKEHYISKDNAERKNCKTSDVNAVFPRDPLHDDVNRLSRDFNPPDTFPGLLSLVLLFSSGHDPAQLIRCGIFNHLFYENVRRSNRFTVVSFIPVITRFDNRPVKGHAHECTL